MLLSAFTGSLGRLLVNVCDFCCYGCEIFYRIVILQVVSCAHSIINLIHIAYLHRGIAVTRAHPGVSYSTADSSFARSAALEMPRSVQIEQEQVPFTAVGKTVGVCALDGVAKAVEVGDELPLYDPLFAEFPTAVVTAAEPGDKFVLAEDEIMPAPPWGNHAPGYVGRLALGADIIGRLADGSPVFVQRTHSHAASHFAVDEGLEGLVRQALPKIAPTGQPSFVEEFNFGDMVGLSELVHVRRDDDMFYARRNARDNYIPYVHGRTMEPTSYVTAILFRRSPKLYELYSAWTGRKTPAIPGTPFATPDSYAFWRWHALVTVENGGRQPYDPASTVHTLPWRRRRRRVMGRSVMLQ